MVMRRTVHRRAPEQAEASLTPGRRSSALRAAQEVGEGVDEMTKLRPSGCNVEQNDRSPRPSPPVRLVERPTVGGGSAPAWRQERAFPNEAIPAANGVHASSVCARHDPAHGRGDESAGGLTEAAMVKVRSNAR